MPGAAERLIEEATAFARARHAYGQPIFGYQAIQFMLADSLTELWAARLMTYQTAHGIDGDLDVKVQHAQCSMAKLYASEMAGRVADRAVQIFGAAATCARTSPSGSTASFAWTGSGRDLGDPAGDHRRSARQARGRPAHRIGDDA